MDHVNVKTLICMTTIDLIEATIDLIEATIDLIVVSIIIEAT